MKSFIEFLEEDVLNENPFAKIVLRQAFRSITGPGVQGTGKELVGVIKPVKPAVKSASYTSNLQKQQLNPFGDLGPNNMPTNVTFSASKPTRNQMTVVNPANNEKNITNIATVVKNEPKALSAPPIVAPKVDTQPKTVTATKPTTATKTGEPTKAPPGQRITPPPPPIEISPRSTIALGKSRIFKHNLGYIPTVSGHGRFYSP